MSEIYVKVQTQKSCIESYLKTHYHAALVCCSSYGPTIFSLWRKGNGSFIEIETNQDEGIVAIYKPVEHETDMLAEWIDMLD